ncbi:MAG: hypothetical protein M4579_002756 [Chaenotheca gracillima]|nr:MAG: hypothetical protein M4579_002756 [Chaenotheca gracillima]
MSPVHAGAMSSRGFSSVQSMSSKLEMLLTRADEIKPDRAIEPPLLASDFGDALESLPIKSRGRAQDAQAKESSGQAGYAVIETAVRATFNGFVKASTSIDEPSFVQVWNLLDIVSIMSDNEQCEPGLVFWLIEELLDSQTIDGCRKVFDYLESRREKITANHFKQKSLIILRSCNELLRRLSRAENTVFCGRVFIFLFQSFPLGDKSSVNLRGEYHVENTTTYDETPPKIDDVPEQMDVDAEPIPENGGDRNGEVGDQDSKTSISEPEKSQAGRVSVPEIKTEQFDAAMDTDTLYPIFWSLQQYFSNPTRLFDTANFATFKSGLGSTMKKFKESQRETDGRSVLLVSEDSKKGTKRKRSDLEDDLSSGFNPKYLTSRDLFDLEIGDLAFRRHILVQSLILLDFLQSLSPKSKAKLGSLHPQNKSVLYQYSLDDDDARWVVDTRAEIAAYLQQGPEGKFYYRMVDTVLSRDKNWVRWKAENCPPIERHPIPLESMTGAKKGVEKACVARRLRSTPVGSINLGFLSDAEAARGLEKLRQKESYVIPDAESFESTIASDEFDKDMAKDDNEKQLAVDAKASKAWRALRIASKSRLNVFDKIDDNAQKLQALFQPESARDVEKGQNGSENTEGKVEMSSVESGDTTDRQNAEMAVSPSPFETSASSPPVGVADNAK